MTYPYRRLIKPRLGTPLIKGHRLSKGLVGLWIFNEGSGNKVFDLSGNGKVGTLAGNAFWSLGPIGSVVDFDGASDKINTPGGSILNPGAWTMVSYLAADDDSGNVLAGWDGLQPTVYLQLSTTGKPIIYMGASNYQYFAATAWNTLKDGNYHHVAFTCPGSAQGDVANSAMYVDGISIAQDGGSVGGAQIAKDTFTLFGTYQTLLRDFNGRASYFNFYDRALSASEIAQLCREPFCMFKDPAEIALLGGYTAPVGGNAGIMTPWGGYWGPTY